MQIYFALFISKFQTESGSATYVKVRPLSFRKTWMKLVPICSPSVWSTTLQRSRSRGKTFQRIREGIFRK